MAIKCGPTKLNQGFTLMELLTVIVIVSILASTALPMFTNYVARTKTTEAMMGIAKIASGEAEYFAKNGDFIEAGPTNIPPSAARVAGNFADDTRWQSLNFSIDGAIQYGYQAVATAANIIDCEAIGDLNGDGNTSTFRRTVSSATGRAELGGLLVFDELE